MKRYLFIFLQLIFLSGCSMYEFKDPTGATVQVSYADPSALAVDKDNSKGSDGAVSAQAFPAAVSTFVKSDVDDIPLVKTKQNKNAYAIVIGIEQYRQKLPRADFAANDARTVAEYLNRVMGYPEENIVTLLNENALKSDMDKYLEKWLQNNIEKNSPVFIYYSGHGAPNPKTGEAYLVPYDGDPSFIEQTGYPLKKLYDLMGKLDTDHVTVVLDSCFSGAGGKSVLAKGARPIVMSVENSLMPRQNTTVLAASSGEQISSTYQEKGHGLFTYFMLKGIKNGVENSNSAVVEIAELHEYVKTQVERISRKMYNNEQSPQLFLPLGNGSNMKRNFF